MIQSPGSTGKTSDDRFSVIPVGSLIPRSLTSTQQATLGAIVDRISLLSYQSAADTWGELHRELGINSEEELLAGYFPTAEKYLNQRLKTALAETGNRFLLQQVINLSSEGDNQSFINRYIKQQFDATSLKALNQDQLRNILLILQERQVRRLTPLDSPVTLRENGTVQTQPANQPIAKLTDISYEQLAKVRNLLTLLFGQQNHSQATSRSVQSFVQSLPLKQLLQLLSAVTQLRLPAENKTDPVEADIKKGLFGEQTIAHLQRLLLSASGGRLNSLLNIFQKQGFPFLLQNIPPVLAEEPEISAGDEKKTRIPANLNLTSDQLASLNQQVAQIAALSSTPESEIWKALLTLIGPQPNLMVPGQYYALLKTYLKARHTLLRESELRLDLLFGSLPFTPEEQHFLTEYCEQYFQATPLTILTMSQTLSLLEVTFTQRMKQAENKTEVAYDFPAQPPVHPHLWLPAIKKIWQKPFVRFLVIASLISILVSAFV